MQKSILQRSIVSVVVLFVGLVLTGSNGFQAFG
jgi:hypothetical protein